MGQTCSDLRSQRDVLFASQIPYCAVEANSLGAARRVGAAFQSSARPVPDEVREHDLEAKPNRLSVLDGHSRKAEPHAQRDVSIPSRSRPGVCAVDLAAHRHRRLTASAVSDRASLENACHALAIGSSLRRYRLAPLAVTGSFGCEGAAITAGEKNGDRQHDSEDQTERQR